MTAYQTIGGEVVYKCSTCSEMVAGVKAARKHAKQGFKTQREAFQNFRLHSLSAVEVAEDWVGKIIAEDTDGLLDG